MAQHGDPASDPTLTPSQVQGPRETVSEDDTSPRGGAAGPRASLPGYEVAGLIGRGGMGEVVLGRDREIGREVAIKRLHDAHGSADAVARFLREARIQARLEHPAIVPVHELGRDADGMPYFTMKRIGGVTLAELLDAPAAPQLQRVLRAFADVCRAIDFAHTRRVVHRDLKPSNIMLGDFGEVYVLDWGLARVIGDDEAAAMAQDVISLDGTTQAGAVLGTPGYMAPEQIEDARGVGVAADVYALGAILFEILAGEALHPRSGKALASTLAGTDGAPGRRRPDRGIAPELDQLCTAALAREPGARPTARELADRLDGYLDGDRDLEHRRRIAAQEVSAAREALASGQAARRAEAMKAAGRALALDPESRAAADLITALMLEPPREEPRALRAELDASATAVQRRHGKAATLSLLAILGFLAICAWNGLYSWPVLGGLAAFTLVLASAALQVSRRAMTAREMLLVTCGNALLVALLSRTFGSLIIVPSVTCVMALSLTSYPQNIDRPKVVIALLVGSWLLPVLLEWAGALEATWRVTGGAVVSTSSLVRIGGAPTTALLVFAHVTTIVVIGLFAHALAASRRDAQRQVEIQAWHLRQLLPS
ncbi:MAG TPA: serine/threonine-protein kinase [Kofleriaceae bacterium]|nr:serine/threonine-protein kinase [Kofleriaceae bacterium]